MQIPTISRNLCRVIAISRVGGRASAVVHEEGSFVKVYMTRFDVRYVEKN